MGSSSEGLVTEKPVTGAMTSEINVTDLATGQGPVLGQGRPGSPIKGFPLKATTFADG